MTHTHRKLETVSAPPRFRLEADYPLSRLTTFGIGGPADWVAFCSTPEEVVEAVELCRANALEYFVVGGGSNILASDEGFRGMIIVPKIETLSITGTGVQAGAGYSLAKLVDETAAAGLAGMEALAGIAGTVGGAVVGNAGAYGQAISDHLETVDLYDPVRGLYSEARANLGFRYRHSNLKWSPLIVLSASFRMVSADAADLKARIEATLAERWQKHPQDDISAGCFFKNVESEEAPHGKIPAGYLIEQAGGKSMAVGNAAVYPKHANILINKGGARASEVRELSLRIKERVKEKYGMELTEEVILLGDFS